MATFGCEACGFEKLVPAACGRLEEPQRCDACNATWTMKLLHNRCWFQNKQLIKMQVRAATQCPVRLGTDSREYRSTDHHAVRQRLLHDMML